MAPARTQTIDAEFDEDTGELALHQPAMMQVKNKYTASMAVQRKRTNKDVLARVLDEAEMCGDDFYYSWTQAGALIEGPSIDGAMIMVRNYGNCAVESDVASEGPTHWVILASFIDFETGFNMTRPFRQRKGESHQKKRQEDADRNVDIAFQIGNSKAQRNVVVKAMPQWLITQAMQRAKDAAAGKYAELPKWVAQTLKDYATIGVTQEELERKVDKPKEAWTTEQIRVFQAIKRAIAARETDVVKEFRTVEAGEAAKPAAATQTPATPAEKPATVAQQAATSADDVADSDDPDKGA